MQMIDRLTVSDGSRTRSVSFWQGNPADIDPADPVDLIIVSAFRDNYVPTPISIIGALDRRGLSVAELARRKAIDLRQTTGFWLSESLPANASQVGVSRILCFEPEFLGDRPTAVVGTLFRGLFPFLPDTERESTVAMAVIATGRIGADPAEMLHALVTAATAWMTRGLPIRELRIMEQHPDRVETLARAFAALKGSMTNAPPPASLARAAPAPQFDVFLSFAKEDGRAADVVRDRLVGQGGLRVFDYRTSVNPGKVWQDSIEAAMESCRKVVAFLSQAYFNSPECKEELNMARLRHKRENQSVLIPLYVRSLDNDAELPLWLQTVTYVDCRTAVDRRTADEDKLAAAASRVDVMPG
ncbi:MAG TPA: toll/interleukin-1 receptor domain-containing protein [Vicinamibacterales bacterium]|nr:toll/interleukin-1 receptor domain-containing protein [Vicinamibacterales bacterium]